MGLNDNFTAGSVRPNAIDEREHNALLMCKKTVSIPDDCQYLFDYDGRADGQPVYVGYCERGVSEDADGTAAYAYKVWLLYKYTYDANSFITSKKTAYGSWTDRSSQDYA